MGRFWDCSARELGRIYGVAVFGKQAAEPPGSLAAALSYPTKPPAKRASMYCGDQEDVVRTKSVTGLPGITQCA
jgi:hypothetical protein